MKKIIALTLVLVMALALCACGGSEKNPAIGSWEIQSVSDGVETTSVSDYPALAGFIVMELKEGGSGTITSGGETNSLTWDDSTITVQGDPATYTVSGDTLTLQGGSYTFVFTRK